MIHPDYRPILSKEELMQTIPGFDWTGGHSGRFLDADKAGRLETLWNVFCRNIPKFTIRCAMQEVDHSDYI